MAYQTLNIIGSFMAGVPLAQRENNVDRERAETFQQLLHARPTALRQTDVSDVTEIDAESHVAVGDAPEERRNPYVLLNYAPTTPENPPEAVPESTTDAEPAAATNPDEISHIDIVV